uniref:ORC1/DEAH AAA+ ATPase domain-containing protein n=1 Tax=Candidatus Kentrum sp. FM TaxID=2126340 RepID=A0A450VW59_9GAMM|nr:MAG: hypothetical protein BECKFM1743A_GA0114220_101069 [Candidatus Kentron sp. FM]VFJ65981.1 MAG: hypothetical protein BECKFM1743C_GA0114222_104081 [Candidatus Kentron sp. FM]VFJ66273.1 MAG: hypothetical protein BECKFM1743C_GA0114222_104182 [Candidatus Kentron sp. FM]VFK08936.1 MAG: hypothetical protein BECKFM1743B_GA0114221_100879 [Candidatus Kentron sp. FM]
MIKEYFRRRRTISDPSLSTAFLENIPDHFFFVTPALIKRLEMLRHLIQSSDFFLVLVGEQGVGKNTLLKQLLISADPQWAVCSAFPARLRAEQAPQPESGLLERLSKGYGLTVSEQDSDSMKARLFDHIGALHDSGAIPIFIIDGNELSLDDLELLAELSHAERNFGARIIFVCEPGGVRQIREFMAELRGVDIIRTMDVPAFTEEQVGDYLHLCWNQTARQGDNPFTDGVIRSMYYASKGLPANVNRLAEQFLQNRLAAPNRKPYAAGNTRQTLGGLIRNALDEVTTQKGGLIALVGGLVAVSGGLLLFASHEPPKDPEMVPLEASISLENTEESHPSDSPALGDIALKQTPLQSLTVTPQEFTDQGTILQKPDAPDQEFRSAIATRSLTVTDPEDITTRASWEPDDASKVSAAKPGTSETPSPQVPDPVTEPNTAPSDADPIKVHPMTTSRDLDSHHKEIHGKTPPTPARESTESSPTNANPTPENQPRQQSPQSIRAPGYSPEQSSVRTIAWLRQQDPDHYTIQLIGLSTKEKLLEFLQEHRLDSQAAWFKATKEGKDLFIAVYGIYPTRGAANIGIWGLPGTLQKNRPWSVSISEILKKAR